VAAVTAVGLYKRLGHRRARHLLLEGAWSHDEARPVDWAVGAAWLMRREAVLDVGPFDESFFMYVEDLEWCWRARARGWEVCFEPEAVVRHVGNASGASRYGGGRTRAYLHNTYRFYRRHHGPATTALWRFLNLAGCSRLYVGSLARRDRSAAAFWADHVRAHLRPWAAPT